MQPPPSSDGWKAFALVGSLGGMIVAALVLFWIAALRMSEARAHADADADASSRTTVAAAPLPKQIDPTPILPPPRPTAELAAMASEAPPTPTPTPTPLPTPSADATETASTGSDASSATLKLFSTPNTAVLCDAVSVGRTPVVAHVAAGAHAITFGDTSIGHKTLMVTVKPGETKSVSARFQEPDPTYP